jgi:hypothetical protein
MRKKILRGRVAVLAFMLLLAAGFACGVIRIDHAAGAYGFSAGTDTAYCSVELLTMRGTGFASSCQAGR